MDAIAKTVWIIESNTSREISLDEIAEMVGLSRFHLTRAFGQSLGRSLMGYARARRLSEAAKKLAEGAPDILSVALDAGYGSHEAFTRAFRNEFGITPEQFRAAPDKADIKLTESFLMNAQTTIQLGEPEIRDVPQMHFVGLGQRFEFDDLSGIPALWQKLNEQIGNISGAVPGAAYGVCSNVDQTGLDYAGAVEVKDFSDVPAGFQRLRVPAQRYAIFTHHGHISEIRSVIQAVFGQWLAASGREMPDAPSLEKYGAAFDPVTGNGGFEMWAPVKS